MKTITIETPRLLLQRLSINEYKELFEHYPTEEAMRYLGFKTEEEFEARKRKYEGGMVTHSTSFVAFQLIGKDSCRVIGDCGFHTWHPQHFRAEIGYGLREENDKNKGYMTEAIRAVVDYGFETMQLNRIEALVSPENTPSLKLVQRLGFVKEGMLREHYCKDGVIEDSVFFGLLKKDYQNQV